MNNKGFSLIELLAVIVVLGLIMSISIPSISNLVGSFRKNEQIEMLKKSAISAAKDYVMDGNINDSINFSSCLSTTDIDIEVEDLIDEYLDANEYYNDKTITIKYDCENKKFIDYQFNE